MKKIIAFVLIVLCGQLVFSQVRREPSKNITPANPGAITPSRIIPAGKATLIRKDVVHLKLQLALLNDSVSITKKAIDDEVKKMSDNLDSMGEMGEAESLRLQMAMDRLSKMMTALSNLMKKISDTAQGITQNMK